MLHGCIATAATARGGEFSQAVTDADRDPLAGRERRRRGFDPGGAAGIEIAPNPVGGRGRAPVALEPLEVEPEPARPRPQVGVVLVPLVTVDRVPEPPEGVLALGGGGLGGGVQRRRPRVLGLDREVADAEAKLEIANRDPGRRALGTAEIEVDDRVRAGAADVVAGGDRRRLDQGLAQRRRPRSATSAR